MKYFTLLALMLCCIVSHAHTDTLRLSTAYTTHIIFSTDITYADLSNSRIVAAKIVEQNRNILALKAKCPFEEYTSVSALESNGTMHTYIVAYEQNPSTLIVDVRQSLADAPSGSSSGRNVTANRKADAPTLPQMHAAAQRLHHLGTTEYDIIAMCENIVSYSDVTYLTLSIRNKSGVSYDIKDATFVIESKKKGRRSVAIEKTIFPEGRHGSLSCQPGEIAKIAYSFKKMTLSKDQVLKVYFYENGGQRNLEMSINTNDINKAERSL